MSLIKRKITRFFFGDSGLPLCTIPQPEVPKKDLKEHDLTGGNMSASLQEQRSQTIYGDSFTDKTGIIHKPVDLDFHNRQHTHRALVGMFEGIARIANLNLENCRVKLQPHHELRFDKCMFLNCHVHIVQSHQKRQEVVFDQCAFRNCIVTYASEGVSENFFDYNDPLEVRSVFDAAGHEMRNTSLSFEACRISDTFINTMTRKLAVASSKIKHVRMRGYVREFEVSHALDDVDIRTVGEGWRSTNFHMIGGVWAPHLGQWMIATQTQFEDTFVDVSQIARCCESKEGVDIQHALVNDEWETLRDAYTGTRFFLHLSMVAGFILPILINVVFNAAYAEAYQSVGSAAGVLERYGQIEYLPMVEVLAFGGYTGILKWVHAGMFIGLVIYNMLRFIVTLWVGALREREEHRASLGFKLCRPPDKQIRWPWRFRVALNWLLVIALSATLWHLFEFLFIDVPYMTR